MDLWSVITGLVVLAASLFLTIYHGDLSESFHSYYHRRPDIKVGPPWLFRVFRPTDAQVSAIASLFTAGTLALGMGLIIYGLSR